MSCIFDSTQVSSIRRKLDSILMKLDGNQTPQAQLSEMIAGLRKIGSEYTADENGLLYSTITEKIRKDLKFDEEGRKILHNIEGLLEIPILQATLAGLDTQVKPVSEENLNETETEPSQIAEQQKASRNYIADAFPNADAACVEALRVVNEHLVKSLLLDLDEGIEISNDVQLNHRIDELRRTLFNKVRSYLNIESFWTYDLNLRDLNDAASTILRPDAIVRHYNNRADIRANKFVEAYNSLFLLNNFDTFIRQDFGKIIGINYTEQTGSLSRYYLDGTGTDMRIDFHDEKSEITIANETSKVVKKIVSALPIYKLGDSKPMIGGRYFGLNEFYYIGSKIKALVYNANAKALTLTTSMLDKIPELNTTHKQYLVGKTLQEVVSRANANSQQAYAALYSLLASPKFIEDNRSTIFGNYTNADLNLLYSMYKGIFESGTQAKSLRRIFENADITKARNYYAFITRQLVDADASTFMQYYILPNGQVVQRNMKDSIIDKSRKLVEMRVNATHSKLNPESYQQLMGDDGKYHINKVSKDSPLYDITFEVQNTKVRLTYNPQTKSITDRLTINLTPKGGAEYTVQTVDSSIIDLLSDYLSDWLVIDLNDPYSTIKSALLDQYKDTKQQYQADGLFDLIKTAVSINFNTYVNNELLKSVVDKYDLSRIKKEIFGSDKDSRNRNIRETKDGTLEFDATSTDDKDVMEHIGRAVDIADGVYANGMVRDGEGNSMSAIAPSRLAGMVMNQYYEMIKSYNGPGSNFSLFRTGGLFTGIGYLRDFALSPYEVKKGTKFNSPEFFEASFLTNFLNILYRDDDTPSSVSKDCAFFPAPVSDKSQLEHIFVNLNAQIPRRNGQNNPFSRINGMTYKALTAKNIQELAHYEMFEYYDKLIKGIFSDFISLNDFAVNEMKLTPLFNMELASANSVEAVTNIFSYLNGQIDALVASGVSQKKASQMTRDYLHNIIVEYQKAGHSDFRLIDQTHYYIDKTGYFRFNTANVYELEHTGHTIHGTFDASKSEYFWNRQSANLIQDLLRMKYSLSLVEDNGTTKKGKVFESLSNMDNGRWVDGGLFVMAKIHLPGQAKPINITDSNSLTSLGNVMSRDFDLFAVLKTKGATLEVNPELAKFNGFQYWFGQSYILNTVGNPNNHPYKKAKIITTADTDALIAKYTALGMNIDTNDAYEILVSKELAARYAAQHKRNVSQTAAKHSYLRKTVNGILDDTLVAVCPDIEAGVYNIYGMTNKAKPFDGATFTGLDQNIFENNSLAADVVGTNKKPFFHFYDPRTGTGGIVKTAGFAITNHLVRLSANSYYDENGNNGNGAMMRNTTPFYKRMAKKMLGRKWPEYVSDMDITVDYQNNSQSGGNKIAHKDIFFSKDADLVKAIIKDSLIGDYYQVHSINKVNGNTYQLMISTVDKYGHDTSESKPFDVMISSNYDLWQYAFGGEYSMSLSNDVHPELEYSEASAYNLVQFENNVGFKGEGVEKVQTAADLTQPLKESSIKYVITAGAIKQGAANINSTAAYYDDNYELSTMQFKATDMGVQLNAEHKAAEEVISLMTQVVNSLSARGYMTKYADEVYEALAAISAEGIMNYCDEKGIVLSHMDSKFQDTLIQRISRSLKNSTGRDGNLFEAIAYKLASLVDAGKKLNAQNTEGKLPLSHPSIFPKVVSLITSAMTQDGIKHKFKGIHAVLNPSYSIIRVYGNRLRKDLHKSIEEYQLEANNRPIYNTANLRIGRTYKLISRAIKNTADITTAFKKARTITLRSPKDYWRLKDEGLFKTYYFVEDIAAGRELGEYGFTFKGTRTEGKDSGKSDTFNLWDLDIVRQNYIITEEIENMKNAIEKGKQYQISQENILLLGLETYTPDLKFLINRQKELRRTLQDTLNAVGSGEFEKVRVNNTLVTVDKSTLKVIPYELVVPNYYKSEFGLKTGDDLATVSEDKQFFVKRLLETLGTGTMLPQNYHIVLKRADGKHVYLMSKNHTNIASAQNSGSTLNPNPDFKMHWFGEKLYRIDAHTGKKLHRLANEGDLVYRQDNGSDVIITDDIKFYLESFKYNDISVSEDVISRGLVEEILSPSLESEANGIQKFIESLDVETLGLTGAIKQKVLEEQALTEEVFNPHTTNRQAIRIRKEGEAIHTSFLQSLHFLAARIPAQSMQSFMAMKVVGFDDTGNNNAFVSHFQLWLQGSDYDIDKVFLLGYEFGHDGKFVGWSPFFDLSSPAMLNASIELPFPSRKELQIELSSDINKINESADVIQRVLEAQKAWKNASSADKLRTKIAYYRELAEGLRHFRNNPIYTSDNEPSEIIKHFKKLVDKHNKCKLQDSEASLKNFVSSYMYKISSDPISAIQSQSPIDEPVEILRKASKDSDTESWDQYDVPGNVAASIKAFVKFMTGKDDISITASGMKSVEGMAHYFNKRSMNPNDPRIIYLKASNFEVCGYSPKMLANTYINSFNLKRLNDVLNDSSVPEANKSFIKSLKEIYDNIDQDDDAMLIISALLGAAVDNAKDPILGMLNGGTDMIGLYVYGVAMGIPFEDLSKCIMHPSVRAITSLMSGNEIQRVHGMSMQNAIGYVLSGPKPGKYVSKEVQLAYDELVGKVGENGTKNLYNVMITGLSADYVLQTMMKAYEETNSTEKAASMAYISKLKAWLDIYESTTKTAINREGTVYSPFTSFIEMTNGLQEFGLVRPMYGLNKEVPSRWEDVLKFVDNFENIFNKRYNSIPKEGRAERRSLISSQGAVVTKTASEVMDNKTLFKDDKHHIDFDKFMCDAEYRQLIIDNYNVLKHSVNIFDAITSDPKYMAYLTTMHAAVEGLRTTAKYRFMEREAAKAMKKNGIYQFRDRANAARQLQALFDSIMNNRWMRESGFGKVTIPAGTKIGNKTYTDATTIQLGTNSSNELFKNWMESVVFADLKRGDLKTGQLLPFVAKNKFIKSLFPRKFTRTSDGNAIRAFGTKINTMPRADFEVKKYQEVKTDFDYLFSSTYAYAGQNLGNLIFLYNLVTYNHANGQNNFSGLFEGLYRGDNDIVTSYSNFIDMLDRHGDLNYRMDPNGNLIYIEGIDYTTTDVLRVTAPLVYPNGDVSAEYVRVKNPDTTRYQLWKRRPKSNSSQEDENIENDFEDNYTDDYYDEVGLDMQDEMYEEQNTTDKEARSEFEKKYELISAYGNRILSSDFNLAQSNTSNDRVITIDGFAPDGITPIRSKYQITKSSNGIRIQYNGRIYSISQLVDFYKANHPDETILASDLDISSVAVYSPTGNYLAVDESILLDKLNSIFESKC